MIMQENFLVKLPLSSLTLLLALFILAGCAGTAKEPIQADSMEPDALKKPGIGDFEDYKPGPGSWHTYLYNSARVNDTEDPIKFPPDAYIKFAVGARFSSSSVEYSSAVTDEGSVYLGSSSGLFYALDFISGDKIWEFEVDAPIDGTASVTTQSVCFGATDGYLYCLDKATGEMLWRYNSQSEIISSPLVSGSALFFTSADNRLHAVSLARGKKLWSYSRRADEMVTLRFFNSPASSKDKLFVLFSDGNICAFKKDSGRLLWKKEVVKDPSKIINSRRTPLYHDGLVYVIGSSGSVLALDALTGDLRVVYDVTNAVDFLVTDESFFVAGDDELISVDRETKETKWVKRHDKGETSSIAGAGSFIVLLSNLESTPIKLKGLESLKTNRGYLQAFTKDKGSLVWTEKLPATVSANASSFGGNLSVLTDKGSLIIYGSK